MAAPDPRPRTDRRAILTGCGVAVLGVGLALLLRLGFDPYLGDQDLAFALYIPAVVAGAAIGGIGPGVLASLLGVAAGLATPLIKGRILPADYLAASFFVIAAAAVVIGGEWFQRARHAT
jgi:two-component system, LuxR family, sensor kinase FixL